MAPKNKGKKGRKDDDDYWCVFSLRYQFVSESHLLSREKAGTSISNNNVGISLNGGDVSDNDSKPKQAGGFSSFTALGGDVGALDEEEDFGGLMVRFILSIIKNFVGSLKFLTVSHEQLVCNQSS